MLVSRGNKDSLAWRVYENRAAMGIAASSYTEGLIKALLSVKSEIRMIFAAAPSQNEVLEGLLQSPNIEWNRITAFHMDEYVGLVPADAPQGFGRFLRDRLFGRVPFKAVHYLNGQASDLDAECTRYGELLKAAPVDICCLGIGENGHIAFNDPPVADFKDPKTVKVVELDEVCRNQQVNDGCFMRLEEVPTHALSLTIPTLMGSHHLVCVVPGITKHNAVQRLLTEDAISESNPASIMRRHPSAVLYLDANSGPNQ